MFETIVGIILPFLFYGARYTQIRYLQPFKDYYANGPNGDAAGYLILIQFFRKFRDGDYDPRCLISKEGIYQPSLYEKTIASIFSDRFLIKYSWFPNFLIFCFALAIFHLTLLYEGYSDFVLMYGLAMFCFTPDHLIGDKWRIHFSSLQPRYLGAVFCSLFFFVSLNSNSLGNFEFLILILIAFVCFQISIFSRQCIVFVGTLFSLLSLDSLIFASILCGFFANLLIFGKSFIFDLKNEWLYHHWYFNNFPAPSDKHKGFKKFISKYLVISVVQFPVYFSFWLALTTSVVGWILLEKNSFNQTIDYEKFVIFFLSVGMVAFITGFRKVACFGESWRYIVFSNLFVLPLFWVELLNNNEFQFLSILILLTVLVFCCLKNYFLSLPEDITESLMDIVNKSKIDDFSNVIWYGVPYSVSNILISRGIGRAGFCFQVGNQSQEIMRRYFIEYPFLNWNEDLLDGHNVTHILLQKEMHNKFINLSKSNLNRFEVISENDEFIIYKYKIPFTD